MRGRHTLVFLAAAVAALAAAPAANATLIFSGTLNFVTDPVAVGSTGNATLSFSNDSTANQAMGAATINDILLDPSCTQVTDPPCPVRDPNVFSISNGTGAAGTACAGSTFTVQPAQDAFTGGLEFVHQPSDLVMLVNQTCLINFTYTALKQPGIDSQPGEPGQHTDQNVMLRVSHPTVFDSPINFGGINDFTAVNPAPAPPAPPTVTPTILAPGPTGEQAAALAKCKKKKTKKKRKKCRKKARELPL